MIRNVTRGTVVLMVLATTVLAGLYWDTSSNEPVTAGPRLEGEIASFQLASKGEQFSNISWNDLSGKPISIKDFSGKVLLINFWATWCAPCMKELPSIDRLQAGMAGSDFAIAAINIDRNGADTIRPAAERLSLNSLELYLDPKGASAKALGVRGMPTALLIDREGRVIGRLEGGAEWDHPESMALVQYFIDNG